MQLAGAGLNLQFTDEVYILHRMSIDLENRCRELCAREELIHKIFANTKTSFLKIIMTTDLPIMNLR